MSLASQDVKIRKNIATNEYRLKQTFIRNSKAAAQIAAALHRSQPAAGFNA
jgi:hypothetical protein